MTSRIAVIVALLFGVVATVVAVQQRGVAADWRSLERQRVGAANKRITSLSQELALARTSKEQLQKQLDTLAAVQAAGGDDAAAVDVLATRGRVVSDHLSACSTSAVVSPACAQAVVEAERILELLNSFASRR